MIETYLTKTLVPILEEYRVPKTDIAEICTDISLRMSSVLAIWDDPIMRKTALFFGLEEGSFYKPSENITVNAFVVITVRNSLLENFHTQTTNRYLSDDAIVRITTQAIEYFSEQDFTKESTAHQVYYHYSLFYSLKKDYPVAWKAIEELAHLDTLDKSYEPVRATEWAKEELLPFSPDSENEVEQDILSLIIGDGLHTDSFKHLSRNPIKLCAVIEYLLRKKKSFSTANYFMRNGYVARGKELLRPSYNSHEYALKLQRQLNTNHLTKKHETFIKTHLGIEAIEGEVRLVVAETV